MAEVYNPKSGISEAASEAVKKFKTIRDEEVFLLEHLRTAVTKRKLFAKRTRLVCFVEMYAQQLRLSTSNFSGDTIMVSFAYDETARQLEKANENLRRFDEKFAEQLK